MAGTAGNITPRQAFNTNPNQFPPNTMRNQSSRFLLLAAACSCLAAAPARAGSPTSKNPEPAIAAPADDKSIYEKIWSYGNLYHNDETFIQDISLSGRAQYEYYNVDADQGSNDDWQWRRLRAGFKMKFANKWLLHAEANFDGNNPDPFYTKLTDALLQYTDSEALVFTVGKQSVKFGLDGGTSSKELITIDRSNLANNLWFTEEYAPGVSVGGKKSAWQYYLGWFTSDGNPEYGDFEAGSFLLASIGYDFGQQLNVDKALLRLDYVYQQPDDGNTATRPFENIGSVNFNLEKGRFGLGTDVKAGQGYGKQGDIFGVQFMPSYYIADGVQVVMRYTYMTGDDNAIRLARYENTVVPGKGDEFNEFYAGVNWYLYGHKLKFQTGVQYAMMDDSKNDGGEYDGWSVVSGIRVSW
jgi:phosphate-selective porin OprO and OprP